MTEADASAVPWSYGEGDALKEIADWMSGRAGWQQQALRWLLDAEKLTEEQFDTLLALALAGKPADISVKASNLRLAEAAKQTVSLLSVDQVEHVNALVPGQRLSFGQRGLTVIYGRNGAGKSGYARILKHACRARRPDRDVILPSIDSQVPGTPTARIKCSVNGKNRCAQWSQGTETDPILSAVSVLNSSTAPIHVDEVNEVAYTPYPLELLERLARATASLKDRVGGLKTTIEQQTPQVLKPPAGTETAVGKLLASFGPKTSEAKVRVLAQMSDGERARLNDLRRDLSTDLRVAAQRLRSIRSELLQFKEEMTKLYDALALGAPGALRRAWIEQETTRQAAELAAAAIFHDEPLPHVGSEAWRGLWEAARRYATQEAYVGHPFPAAEEGDRCVLCQQTLATDAAERFRRFEAFVQNETGKRAEQANATYKSMVSALSSAVPHLRRLARLRSLFADQIGDPVAAREIRIAFIQLRWNARRTLGEHVRGEPALPEADAVAAMNALDRLMQDLESRAVALSSEAGSEDRQRLQAEGKELEDRLWLGTMLEDVLEEIKRKQQLTEIRRVSSECATNAITSKATDLAEKLITDALRAKFNDEVRALGVDYARVELRREQSRSGAPRFRVRFLRQPGVGVGKVLSEGEHRAVALAAFLAEQATAGGRSSIIFDDPVSSLDNEHREQVARRIVREAKQRQVIVFTHDIAFLLLIDRVSVEEQAEKPLYRTVSRGGERVGLCSTEAPYNARVVLDVLQAIENDLDNKRVHFEHGREHDWRITVRSFQDQLRECWERAVEEFVGPVFKRLSAKVDTRGLEKLIGLTKETCDRMRAGYGRCSALLHSTSDVLNPPLPSPDRVRAEINEIREWYQQHCVSRNS